MTPKQLKAFFHGSKQEFVALLPLIEYRAFQLGLLKTGHALNHVVKTAGYELAEQILKSHKGTKRLRL